MIVKFNNDYLEKLYLGLLVKGKPRYQEQVITKFKKTILMLKNAEDLSQLKLFRGLNFEALKGDYKGFYSVRVDYHYRLILGVELDRILVKEVLTVEDLTNHYQ
ncbi:MAG: type II toxin-antitoxin system RelE/ParE family toxin [Bacteroidota bacterium]